jgi:hypothetical protein|tara:strand:+ start:4859 stop:5521 length:663 start_codon:yes stop_codon:yes gene_type:complete
MNHQKKIEESLSRSVCGGWDRDFLKSILVQLSKDRALTTKQKQTLGKVLARNTEEDQKNHDNWTFIYEKEYKNMAIILAEYHVQQPYYQPMASDILRGCVPERGRFLRMYSNKYSKKVLVEYNKVPRYDSGAYVIPRASFNVYKNVEWCTTGDWASDRTIVEKFKKRGGFILGVENIIKTAAKGAKRYKILTIGESRPLIIEERFLKHGKKSTKKVLKRP